MFATTFLLVLFALLSPAASAQLPVHNITRLPPLKFENLAIRSNGQILTTTSAPTAQVYQVDPLTIRPPVLVADFPAIQHATGIYELTLDVFYVALGNITITKPNTTYPDTLSIQKIDMRPFAAAPNGTILAPASIEKVADVPQGALLNGMTSIPGQDRFVLVADTFRGVVWHIDVTTGEVREAFRDSTLAGQGTTSTATGVNGLKIFDGDLYYTNTETQSLYKVPIGLNGFVSACEKPILIADKLSADDFVVDECGDVYVASPSDVLFRVSPEGEKEVVAGTLGSNSSELVGPTAVAFGRSDSDGRSLYVTTNGGAQGTVEGTEGVSRVDLGM